MRKRENWLFLFGAIGAAAGVVKILEYLGITPKVVMPVAHSVSGLISAGLLFAFSIGLSIAGFYTARQGRSGLEKRLAEKMAATVRRDEIIAERDQMISGLERENRKLKDQRERPTEPPSSEQSAIVNLFALASQAETPEQEINALNLRVKGLEKDVEHYKQLWSEELGKATGFRIDIGLMKLYDLGCKYQRAIIPHAWHVLITYFDRNDTELAEKFEKIFKLGMWAHKIVYSDEHVTRISQDQPRIFISTGNDNNRKTVEELVTIFLDAELIREPGGIMISDAPITPPKPVDFGGGAAEYPEICVEILPRKTK